MVQFLTADRTRSPRRRLDALLPSITARAADVDASGSFARKSYAALKSERLMALAVPQELEGEGVPHRELCEMIRSLARACGSTALAFSMHTQAVAGLAWSWRHQKAPVGSILRRIARENLAIVTTNGSDWLSGSGIARRIGDGFEVDAEKKIVSAAEVSDLVATNAVYDDPLSGAMVLHFIAPLDAAQIRLKRSWDAMGMRATGSETLVMRKLTVSDRAIVVRRPRGVWHPLFHAAVMTATPLIFSVYHGIAEAARDLAVAAARERRQGGAAIAAIASMEMQLNTTRIAIGDLVDAAAGTPSMETTNRVQMARTLAADSAIATVVAAMELVGGATFAQGHTLERLFRDVQAARFHPLTRTRQIDMAGRLALGLDVDDLAATVA